LIEPVYREGSGKRCNAQRSIKGIFPFIVDLIILALYIAFPQIALFLPQQMMGK
jgi:TRAP-type C4-dicarboxylate transport system permease large subunit